MLFISRAFLFGSIGFMEGGCMRTSLYASAAVVDEAAHNSISACLLFTPSAALAQ